MARRVILQCGESGNSSAGGSPQNHEVQAGMRRSKRAALAAAARADWTGGHAVNFAQIATKYTDYTVYRCEGAPTRCQLAGAMVQCWRQLMRQPSTVWTCVQVMDGGVISPDPGAHIFTTVVSEVSEFEDLKRTSLVQEAQVVSTRRLTKRLALGLHRRVGASDHAKFRICIVAG